MSGDERPPSWERVDSRQTHDLRIFRVREDDLRSPRTGAVLSRVILETPDWVNVVARTEEGLFVGVRQFRFGTRAITLEIPGGMVDPGEAPREAGARELLEETGYAAASWRSLGSVEPNPAFHDNRCHTFLAEGARKIQEPMPDEGEDLRVVTLTEAEVLGAIRSGEIAHSLVLCALCRVLDLRGTAD